MTEQIVAESRENWNQVMDADQVRRAITRMAYEVLERNRGSERIAIVGIRRRGEHLAQRLSQEILRLENITVPHGIVDITLYRDDLTHSSEQPLVRGTDLPFHVERRHIILVDDVLFTGRTIRSALDAIIDFGRPRSVQLAVLVDRGHRELPIRADYVGRTIATAKHEVVQVCLNESDNEDSVYVRPGKRHAAHEGPAAALVPSSGGSAQSS